MNYIIGQVFGLIASFCCLIQPLWKKKWQMLVVSALANLCAGLNLVFLGQIGSGVIINSVAVVQGLVMLWHVKTDRPVTIAENIVFLAVYVGSGFMGFKGALDLLPIAGSVLFMLMSFQRDEQKSRWLLLFNATIFFVYYFILRSTTVFAEIFAIITSVIALYKYRGTGKN